MHISKSDTKNTGQTSTTKKKTLTLNFDSNRYLGFDKESGRLFISDDDGEYDVFIVSVITFFGIVEEFVSIFGSGATAILQKAGEGAGRRSAKHLLLSDDKVRTVKSLFNSISRWGFGRYELVELDEEKPYVLFKLHNCVFAKPTDAPHNEHSMQYIQGFYYGYFSEFFKKDIRCLELKCISLGDAYCEFEIRPANISNPFRSEHKLMEEKKNGRVSNVS